MVRCPARRIFPETGCRADVLASRRHDFSYFLILGRVTKGDGGDIVIAKAKEVLDTEFPELDVEFVIPDEHMKGIGQCVAAAAMPEVKK